MIKPMEHIKYMKLALKEAQKANDIDEVPIGAVIVRDGKVIAKAHNLRERSQSATAHAEVLAITSACNYLGAKYLNEATVYVTVEPCLMCCGALYWSKVGKIVYGAGDIKNGYQHITKNNWPFHQKAILVKGVLEKESAQLMIDFFKAKR